MEEIYVKDSKIKEKDEIARDIELIESLYKAKNELQTAINNFEHAEEELVDYYTYQIKAIESKLDYLVKKAKRRRLVLSMVEATKYEEKAI